MTIDPSDVIEIDVISDVMCPWCYIGKRRLEKALAMVPDVPVDIRWRPFQLDHTIPESGMDRKEYLRKKFGSDEQAAQVYDPVRAAGKDEAASKLTYPGVYGLARSKAMLDEQKRRGLDLVAGLPRGRARFAGLLDYLAQRAN